MSRVHAFTDDALGDLDAVGIADTLRSGERSVPDLVDAAIARAESVDPQLAAIVHRDYARARRRSLAPSGGFFAGVPTFIKDNIDVAGLPTQFGTDAFVGTVRPKDSPFARLLHSAGFLPLGKTQLSEFGVPRPSTLGSMRCATRGIPLGPRGLRPPAPRRWSRPEWCRLRMPTTAADRSGSRRRRPVWWV